MDSSLNPTSYKDYYKILHVDYDAAGDQIRLNYKKLALKWHPDKHKGDAAVTAIFQEINEAYSVLSDPNKRLEYDLNGNYEIDKYTLREYLCRSKGMILTCNGLGSSNTTKWIDFSGRRELSAKAARQMQINFQVEEQRL